jgi:hypothetical protein
MPTQDFEESRKFPAEKARDLLKRGNELLEKARELGLTPESSENKPNKKELQ